MDYDIKVSDSGKITRHEWSTEGYQLLMITQPDAEPMFSITSPSYAANIVIDNFDKERPVEIAGTSSGVAPQDAAAWFAEIVTAVRIAGDFQKIVDSFK